jgi:hypothetical protein
MKLRLGISYAVLLLQVSFSLQGFCQSSNYTIPNNSTFNRLLVSKKQGIRVIKASQYINNILPIKGRYSTYEQEVILLNHRIYIYLNASGIVYESQLESLNQDSLYFKRIDSTEHAGYNINCFPFVYNSNLYNIGGYGFWRWNGQLRSFIPKSHEWDIVPLNFEVPIAKQESQPVIWQNTRTNQIMVLSYMQGNAATSSDIQHRSDTVMSLDLATKKWNLVGGLNPDLAKTLPTNRLIANMDSGLLVNNTGVIEFWNLVSNRVLKLKDTPYKQNLLTGHYMSCFSWNEANKILFSDPALKYSLDSMVISPTDFELTEKPIYYKSNNSSPFYWGLGISLFVAGLYGYSKSRTITSKAFTKESIQIDTHQSRPDLNSSYPKQHLFTSTESDLIRLIIRNVTERNRYTNVDEINRVLGVGNKSIDMQKRKRSDVIKNINDRYALATNRDSIVLINRIKSQIDGRLYEFYITEEELTSVLKHIQ